MNSLIKALASRKVLLFGIYAVLGAVAVVAVLVMGFIYSLWGSYFYWSAYYKAQEPKLQIEMEQKVDRVIPSDFTLTESKFSPDRGIDQGPFLTRTYTVNKPRDVVIDELLRSLKAQGYSPEVDDYPGQGM